MTISIITTCFNRKNTIASALESIFHQDYAFKEHVLIDGGSTDGSLEVIQQYQEHLAVCISEPDTGIYNALNKGIKHCTGDIIGILHSDDVFYNHSTLSQIAKVFKETQADLVYANGLYVDEQIEKVKRIYPSKKFKKWFLYIGWIPLHTTIFVRKEVFEKYGLYREDFQIASDYDISLRWFQNSEIKKVHLNRWVVKMRLGGKSTNMKQQRRKSQEDLQIIKEHHLWGKWTLFFKIIRKIPQYLLPKIIHYKF